MEGKTKERHARPADNAQNREDVVDDEFSQMEAVDRCGAALNQQPAMCAEKLQCPSMCERVCGCL